MSDTSYEATQDTCMAIQSALEHAMNDRELLAASSCVTRSARHCPTTPRPWATRVTW